MFEELAYKIYRDTPQWDEAVSFEYWCNIIEQGQGTFGEHLEHPWHTDRDEDVLAKEKKFVTPLMGSVLLQNSADQGSNVDTFSIYLQKKIFSLLSLSLSLSNSPKIKSLTRNVTYNILYKI